MYLKNRFLNSRSYQLLNLDLKICLSVALVFAFSEESFAQMSMYTAEQRTLFTSAWEGERFDDGRPKVPDSILERMKNVTAEEAWSVIYREGGFKDHFEGDWKEFNASPDRLVGRVVTALFLPTRPDVRAVVDAQGKAEKRSGTGHNSWVIDTLQPGDVLVVDMSGYNFLGDRLANAIYGKSQNGIVIEGGLRDLSGIQAIEGFKGYVRRFHPSAVTRGGVRNTMLMGMNVPIRIGDTTVMPGDIVLGDPEGLMFIPPQLAEKVVGSSEDVRRRDQWSALMLQQGTYSPGQLDTTWTDEIEADFAKWAEQHK
ncbi:MAG: dimethylmenaquinone methyltransferase [Opitutaceae bacterium]|nr:dimethylmenaquinone methyltransferase [Opitutaceae bacterium]|tara:strand:+ start:6566 stop:7501 length:936 start_codon:yes stop_codon:yes gene_type:complete